MTGVVPQFWHVNYPVQPQRGGPTSYMVWLANSEHEARDAAAWLSRDHGHATVTNREGLVATYVNGAEWAGTASAAVGEAERAEADRG